MRVSSDCHNYRKKFTNSSIIRTILTEGVDTCTSIHSVAIPSPSTTGNTHSVLWTIGFDHMTSEGCYGDDVGVDSSGSLRGGEEEGGATMSTQNEER